MAKFESITYNGINSYEDLGLIMPTHPQIKFISKEKDRLRIPWTNTFYDPAVSRDIEMYQPRRILCTFNVVNFESLTIEQTQRIAIRLSNWLFGPTGSHELRLSIFPHYHFIAEPVKSGDFETGFHEVGVVEIEFEAYPFKIRNTKAGKNIYDDIIWDIDYIQQTTFPFKAMDAFEYKQLAVGDMVTLGGWTQYVTGMPGKVRRYQSERFYEITEIQESTLNANLGTYSKHKYVLDGKYTALAQDVVQARERPDFVINLYNNSTHKIKPEIIMTEQSPTAGITIMHNGNYYNFKDLTGWNNEPNDRFLLDVGLNEITIWGQGCNLNIEWADEVL